MPYEKRKEDWVNTTDYIDEADVDAWEQAIYDVKTSRCDIRDYGASLSSTDNTEAIQAAIDDSGTPGHDGSSVFIPRGRWQLQGSLQMPAPGNTVRLVGEGNDVSVLFWTEDLGTGEYAIAGGQHSDNRFRTGIYQLSLWGPTHDFGTPYGDSPADMDGIQMAPRYVVHGCRINGFRAGITISGDHCTITRTYSGGNYYGLYFGGGTQFDDHYIADFDFTSNRFASIACGPNDRLAGTTLINGHLGFNPYCFYKEPDVTNVNFISANRLIDVAFEGYGNAIIWDEDQDANVTANQWIGCNETGAMSDYYSDPSRDQDYVVRCSFWSDNIIVGGEGFQSPGHVGFFDCSNWTRTTWFDATALLGNLAADVPLLTGLAERNTIYAQGLECRVIRAGPVDQYDLIAPTGSIAGRKYINGFDKICAGVAQHDAPASGWVIAAVRGLTPINSSGAIAALRYVKQGGGDGLVVLDGTTKTLDSIGYSAEAASGDVVDVFLQGIT